MEKLMKFYRSFKFVLQNFYIGDPQSTYIDFNDFFSSEGMINFFGFNNLPRNTPLSNDRKRRMFYTMSMINWVIFMVLNIISIAYGLKKGGSFLVLTENVGVVCISGMVLIEGITIMYWHRKKLMDIVIKLKQHYPYDAWNQQVFDVPQHLQTLNVCGKICAVLYKGVMVQYTGMPIFIILFELAFGLEITFELIIQLLLPIDTTNPIIYLIIFINGAWALIVGTFTVLITDFLFTELIAIINLELMALAQLMSEIDPSDGQHEAIKELKRLSETHQELIELSEDLRNIISPLLFINCFGMMIVLCCAAFLTLSGISNYFLIKYALITLVSAWNSFIVCFYGDRLNDASLSVAQGVYNCNWMSGNCKFRKMILIVMVRARKVQELTGMEFLNINLETYQWIVQAAFSYYSVLSAVYKP
ncbi:hypothetical protein ACKWTF_013520 [Chironomus riparius]